MVSTTFKTTLATAALLTMIPLTSQAMTFQLGDHPNGAEKDNYDYGLRLDGAGPRFFTFNASLGSAVFLNMQKSFAQIYGTVRESVSKGTAGANDWDIYYEMTPIVVTDTTEAPLNNGFSVFNTLGANGTGYLTNNLDTYYKLTGKAKVNTDYTFEFDDDGHRVSGNDDWVGRGWVDIESCDLSGQNCTAIPYDPAQDFLFTATDAPGAPPPPPIPLPAAGFLLIGALGVLGGLGMRRNAA